MLISLKQLSSKIEKYNFELLHNDRKMDKNIAKENIIALKNIFEQHQIKYWLCFGTLLGAVRENNFIEHDVDTDIGVEFNEISKLEVALSDLIKIGFEIIRVTSDLSLVSLLKNNEYIDLYLFRKINNNEDMSWRCSGYIVKQDYFSELEYIQFLDEQFLAPVNYIKYLEEIYGLDWKVPKQNAHAMPINVTEEIYKQYYQVLNKWLELSLNDSSISSILEYKNINRVIIYGMGNIGKRLIQDIEKKKELEIVGLLDENITDENYGNYKVLNREHLVDIGECTVIVTPFYYLDFIKEDLLATNNELLILGINEILT